MYSSCAFTPETDSNLLRFEIRCLHGKRHLANIIEILCEIIRNAYSSELRELAVRPGDVVQRDSTRPKSAAKVPSVVQEGNDGVPKRISGFVTEFANILLRIAKQKAKTILSARGDLLNDTFLKYMSSPVIQKCGVPQRAPF